MDFENLPDIVFLRIFDFLPLKDRFRVGRVSQSFRRISHIVNGRIKSLDLDDRMFYLSKFDEEHFEVILRQCHQNLREIKFFDDCVLLPPTFSKFTCPKLVDLDLQMNLLTDDVFARIVTNHPNLKSLKWLSLHEDEDGEEEEIGEDDENRPFYRVVFPPVTLPNLETLHIRKVNNDTLERLIDRCPYLKNLEISLSGVSSDDILDRFFRSVPRLESLRWELDHHSILMGKLEWFWRLPLKSLTIEYDDLDDDDIELMINDDFVYKLIECFKNVEYLDLDLMNVSDGAVVAALAGLEKLRVAKLDISDDEFADGSIREFSACRSLEELYVCSNDVSDQTILELFRNCPNLRKLYADGVYDNDSNIGKAIDAETAGMLILELANVPRRPSITIKIYCGSNQMGLELQSVWESIQVQNAVRYSQETHGMKIDIRFADIPFAPPVDEMMEQGGDSDVESDNQVEDGDQVDDGQVDDGQVDGDQMDVDQGGGNQPDA